MIFLERICATFISVTLGRSALRHFHRRTEFESLLEAQHFSRPQAAALGLAVPGFEGLAASLAVLIFALPGSVTLQRVAFSLAAALALAFGWHVRSLARAGYGGDCGCTSYSTTMSEASSLPSASVLALSSLGLVASLFQGGLARPALAVAIAQGVAVAIIIDMLPTVGAGARA